VVERRMRTCSLLLRVACRIDRFPVFRNPSTAVTLLPDWTATRYTPGALREVRQGLEPLRVVLRHSSCGAYRILLV
jgi:hypothetical protein